MAQFQQTYVQSGVYLVLEKTKTIAFRNLFKRVYVTDHRACVLACLTTWYLSLLFCSCSIAQEEHKGVKFIQLAQFEKAVAILEMPLELDEIECIVANLIFMVSNPNNLCKVCC